ncbi:MAG: glycosyltransferase family 2 protein [Verrucomicrobiota bacterium]
MNTRPGLTIIIPAYNEAAGVTETLKRLFEAAEQSNIEHEVIVVDDCSTDATASLVEAFPKVNLIRHRRNQGYGASIKTGMRRAKYDWTGIVDADGTYDPAKLFELYGLGENCDMVVGSRTGENVEYSTLRKIPKIFLRRFMVWIAQEDIPDMNSGLRVFRTEVGCKYMPIYPSGFSLTTTITMAMLCNQYAVKFVPIDYFTRQGVSHIKPIRDTLRFIRLIAMTGMMFAPLRILGPLIIFFFFGFVVSLFYDVFFLQNLTDKTLIFLTTGFNLSVFGALAEMIRKYREIS